MMSVTLSLTEIVTAGRGCACPYYDPTAIAAPLKDMLITVAHRGASTAQRRNGADRRTESKVRRFIIEVSVNR
jgi:hypothetical protein